MTEEDDDEPIPCHRCGRLLTGKLSIELKHGETCYLKTRRQYKPPRPHPGQLTLVTIAHAAPRAADLGDDPEPSTAPNGAVT
jgi:hypothetical protein